MPLLDYAGTLRAGQSLVPDFRLQALQDEQFAMQREQMGMQRERFDMERQAMEQQAIARQQAQERQAAFQQGLQQAMARGGTSDAVTDLMLQFPDIASQYSDAFDRLEESQKQAELTAMGSIYSRVTSGDVEGAANLLEQRVMADREAGTPDPQDEALLTALQSGDEREVAIARTMMGTALAGLAGVDTFRAVYGGDSGEDRTAFQKDYDFIARQYGQQAADQYAQGRYDPVVVGQPGAPIYRQSQVTGGARPPASQRGGDPSGSRAVPVDNGQTVIESLFPGIRVTQNRRDPNSALGRANPGSWHNRSGGAVDVAPVPGMSFDQFVSQIEAAGYPVIESRDEVRNPSRHATGPHWHVVIGQQAARVTSRQQYDRLPSGTRYIAPDGSQRVKP
ncbi:hypothetical protein [Aurantiacibacter spongiae]|uniref:Uncharacterized protein n=1 Tax=Aurantiacibacter spongiae TaxID=2488860 RepID=A0A3N5CNC8_9SPHN|nr:hypothetical protein [Aurantiacibacter spongiae]RPF70443.1 hypothetical protein EG799_01470 [Aurantiacibacter spongiae]